MPEQEKVKILQTVLGGFISSGPERLFKCPRCNHHKYKLSVNIPKNKFKCWVCDYAGHSIRRLIRNNGTFTELTEWDRLHGKADISLFEQLFVPQEEEPIPEVHLPEEFLSLAARKLPLVAKPAMKYLTERGITRDDILRWKIGFCPGGEYGGRVVVPSFSMDGDLNYFVGRTYTNHWRRYDQPSVSRDIVFNHLYIDWDSDLVIVEGVFDAIVAGANSVPILGSILRENSKLFQEIVKHDTPVYVALDPDAEKKALRLIKQLLEYGIELYKIDISPYGDVGEMFREEFNRRKEKAMLMDNDSYLLYCARRDIK